MGFLDKLAKKVADGYDGLMTKNMSEEKKAEYFADKEKRKQEKLEEQRRLEEAIQKEKEEIAKHKVEAEKSELKNLEPLLEKIDVLDENKLWVAGFYQRGTDNVKVGNMLSGNKNIKTISVCGEYLYFCDYKDGHFRALKRILIKDVAVFDIEGIMPKRLTVRSKDRYNYMVQVTENKGKLAELKKFVKANWK